MLTEAEVWQEWPAELPVMAVSLHAQGWDKGAGRIGLTFQLSPLCHRVPLARHVPSESQCPPPCGYTAGPQPPKHKTDAGWSLVHFYGPALFPQYVLPIANV